ncbi:MAG: DUF3108 domain-containing protein [Gammaproteobacteria bacterium]|nr:DUF3108 domain-containing protein [Gammaproteobacteria bacterium]
MGLMPGKNIICSTVCVALILVITPLFVFPDSGGVSPFAAEYLLKRSGFTIAVSEFRLSKKDTKTYIFESLSRPAGMVSLFKRVHARETSELGVTKNGFKPLNYAYVLEKRRNPQHYSNKFDWENKTVVIEEDGKKTSLTVSDNTLNRFTLQLMLMADLGGNKEVLEYTILHKSKLETFVFTRIGKETIKTSTGSYSTVVIEGKKKDKSGGRVMTFWCAPSLNYLPVKIIQEKDDKQLYTMFLTKVEGL